MINHDPREQYFIEAIFENLMAIDHFENAPHGEGKKNITTGMLYEYAIGRDPTSCSLVEAALAHDIRVKENLEFMLSRISLEQMPRVAAASSGDVTTRIGNKFQIELLEPQVELNEQYIIISLMQIAEVPPKLLRMLLVDGTLRDVPLPEPYMNKINLIEEVNSPLVAALRDRKTQIFLCDRLDIGID